MKFPHVQTDPNELDPEEGILPINEASIRGFTEIVRILLDYSASVYVSDPFENTPLIAAASNGHLDCVQLLHSHGCPSIFPNGSGCTALGMAALQNHSDVIEYLLTDIVQIGIELSIAVLHRIKKFSGAIEISYTLLN